MDKGEFASQLAAPDARSNTAKKEKRMTDAKSDKRNTPDENSRLKNGLTRETPTTEDAETITLGGLTFRRIPDEEGEAEFWRREAIIARRFGTPFDSAHESQHCELLGEPGETEPASGLVQSILVARFEPMASAPERKLAQPAPAKTPDVDTLPILPVPPGLSRCPVCNQYRGTIEIDDESVHSRKKGDSTEVQCICDGILCSRCKVNRIPRPISNQWGERRGFGHVPYFVAMLPCKECRAKEDAAYAARKRESECLAAQKELPTEESK
jgi:hypothetical protein